MPGPPPDEAGEARGRRHLDNVRTIARVLDSAVRIPGTDFRFGLDPLIGLIPGLGDVAGAAFSGYIVVVAARLGAPPSVVARMLGNIAIDSAVGAVPLLGDLFDAGFRANLRNAALLEAHAAEPTTARRSSRAVVAVVLLLILLLLVGAVTLGVLLTQWLVRALR